MPSARPWRMRWDGAGTKGMWSSVVPRALPPEYGLVVRNGDFIAKAGALSLATGFGLHDLAWPIPVNMGKVISLGFLPYVKVWDGSGQNKLNYRMGRLIAQVNVEDGISFYWREINFAEGIWGNWQGPFTWLDYGSTVANRIRWNLLTDGAMRGACGNEANNTPLWIGYVNRNKYDDNGFFHAYITVSPGVDGGDMETFSGILLTEDLPRSFDSDLINFLSSGALVRFDYMGFHQESIITTFTLEYDGYQAAPYEASLMGSRNHFISTTVGEFSSVIPIELGWLFSSPNHPFGIGHRITGINVWQARRSLLTSLPYGDWQLAYRIDSREGVQSPVFSFRSEIHNEVGGLPGNTYAQINGTDWPIVVNDIFNEMFIEIDISGTRVERYKIIDCITSSSPNLLFVYFNRCAESGLNLMGTYNYNICSRWYAEGEVGEYRIKLFLAGVNSGTAPSCLPAPELLGEGDVSKFPRATYNYRHDIEFQDRHVIGNIYDYFRSAKMPMRVMYSDPKLQPNAGLDVFPNFFDLQGCDDDEIRGFVNTLNLISIFTKHRTFKAAFEPLLQRRESPYPVGLAAPDSLVSIGLNHWFLGQIGNSQTVMKYDGIHEPANVGYRIQADLDAALYDEGCVPELSQGWYDKDANQYRLAVKSFAVPSELWVVVIDMPADLPPSRRFFKSVNGGEFQQINMGGSQGGWNPLTEETINKWKTVSFQFTSDGTAFWAATTAEEENYYYLYCQKYTIATGDWSLSPRLFDTKTLASGDFYNPDIVMDGRDLPIMVVNKSYGGTDSGVWLYWFDVNMQQQSVKISGNIIPTGKGSIVRWGDKIYVHAERVSDSTSYLYVFNLENGVPVPAGTHNWIPVCQPNMQLHQMAVNDAGIGILGRDTSSPMDSSLDFRLYSNLVLGDREIVVPSGMTILNDAFGLVFRDGQWQALISEAPAPDLRRYKRSNDGIWAFDQSYVLGSATSQFNLFGITAQQNNPESFPADGFGCMVVECYDTPYTVKFQLIESPMTGTLDITTKAINQGARNWQKQANYRPTSNAVYTEATLWPYGDLVGTTIFGFDIDGGAPTIIDTYSDLLKVADIVEIQARQVFTEGETFLYFWDEFKDYSEAADRNRRLWLTTGMQDAGIGQTKLATLLTIHFVIPATGWLDVTVINELGESIAFTGDPDDGGSGLRVSDSGVPKPITLLGRAFKINLIAESEDVSGSYVAPEIHGVELVGNYFGGIV